MTDEQKQEQQQAEGTPPATEGAPQEPDWKAEAEKWKAMARKHEGQAKTNAEAARRLADLEDANKSETQKLADKAAVAEKRAAEAEVKAARYEVASRLGIHSNHLKYLSGSTAEEIEEAAKAIRDDFPETYAEPDTDSGKPTRPRERLRSGAVPDEEPDETNPRKLAAALPRL
jgi:gamma-glutamyl:cysteine ligase YbdK (ATP-grasp superfamily)